MGFFTQIKEKLVGKSTKQNEKYVVGLDKSSETFSDRINELAARFREINDEYFEELENILIMADVGVSMVMKIVSEIKTEVRIRNITDPREINDIIVDKMFVIYANESVMSTKINYSAEGLTVILMVGVNGAGKTTTIGKLAHRIVHDEGKKVVVAAGDTFRAGAIDQLAVWAERVGVDIVKGKEGGDPSAVVFDALNKAKETGADVLICDTAGRLHNKKYLMDELIKIKKVIDKELPDASKEILMVLDATTGQNAISQVKAFKETVDITGLVLTKLDGTAKGGVVIGIANENKMPVKFIGIGEQIDDMEIFSSDDFVKALI